MAFGPELGQLEALIADNVIILSSHELVTVSELIVLVLASLRLPTVLTASVQSAIINPLHYNEVVYSYVY